MAVENEDKFATNHNRKLFYTFIVAPNILWPACGLVEAYATLVPRGVLVQEQVAVAVALR